MADTPSQFDVDAVAHFVQAARDLKSSPFFIAEQTTLGVSYSQNASGQRGPMRFQVPDPRVRDATIIPFRRMWMTNEPANFDRVSNIIKRYCPESRGYVDYFKNQFKECKTTFSAARFMGLGSDGPQISPEDVIDMWLNCRLAHVGAKAGKGRFVRSDFEHAAHRLGDAKFEYLFMNAVYHVGLCFINLLQFTESLLQRWADDGQQPSVIFDDIMSVGTIQCPNGDSLKRSKPGLTIADDDLPTKLSLLRRRRAYSEISKLIAMLPIDNSSAVVLIKRVNGIEGLLSETGFSLETVGSIEETIGFSQWSTISDDFTDLSKHPWRKGAIARFEDSTIKIEGDAKDILSEQFAELTAELLGSST